MPGVDTVKLFCPNCNDIYTPSSSRFSGVDGAFFGTTFAHLFFHTYREYCPAPFLPGRRATANSPPNHASPPSSSNMANNGINSTFVNPNQYGGQKRPEGRVYVPKIYGFKVSERAKSGPRMAWLRMRPSTFEELDSVDSRGRWIAGSDTEEDDKNGPGGPGRRGRFDDVSL
jgi:casein kinase II subunit beta